jgi:hypothetical protein
MSDETERNAMTPEDEVAGFVGRLFAPKPDAVAFVQALHPADPDIQPGIAPIELEPDDPRRHLPGPEAE